VSQVVTGKEQANFLGLALQLAVRLNLTHPTQQQSQQLLPNMDIVITPNDSNFETLVPMLARVTS
jgi:hypothetical protein